jgi:hypothetical protein
LIAAVLLLAAFLRGGEGNPAELGHWLGIAGAGALVAVAAWAVYVPAPDHYSPAALGTVNRVNAAAGIGIAILVYSCLVLLARILAGLLRLPASAAALGASVAALVLCGTYVVRSTADARAWDAAAADQRGLLAALHAALPRPPGTAVLYVFGTPRTVGPGVPVLNTTLDLTSALRIFYSGPGLQGVPVAGAGSLGCGPRGPLAGGVGGAYGESYLIDVRAPRAVLLADRAGCLAEGGLGLASGRTSSRDMAPTAAPARKATADRVARG